MTIRQLILHLFCTLGLSTFLSAQSSVHLYGTCNGELVKSIAVDNDGYQYILNENMNEDYYTTPLSLSKLTPTHELLWTKTIELDSSWQNIYGRSILCFDSTVFIGGTYFHYDPVTGDYGWRTYLAHYTNDGELLWFKNLDKHAELNGSVFLERLNDNIIHTSRVGTPTSFNPKQTNICCMDVNGNVQWSKRIEDALFVSDFQALPDSSFIALGSFPYSTGGVRNFFLLKMSLTGNIIWQKSFSSPDTNEFPLVGSLALLSGTDIIIGGKINHSSPNYTDGYFGKVDSNTGNLLFSKKINIVDNYNLVRKVISKDGMYYLVGTSRFDGDYSISPDLNLAKIDTSGLIEWMYTYNDSMNVNITDNQLLIDAVYSQNSIITVGSISNYGWPHVSGLDIIQTVIRSNGEATHKKDTLYPIISDYPLVPYDSLTFTAGYSSDTLLLVHTDTLDFHLDFSDCMLSTASIEEETMQANMFSVYPNPANEVLNISCVKANLNFTLYDLTGRELIRTCEKIIPINHLASGYYLVNCELGTLKFYKN